MHELNTKIKQLSKKVEKIKNSFDIDEKKKELLRLESDSMDPNLWDDRDGAKRTMQSLGVLKEEIDELEKLEKETGDFLELTTEGNIPKEFSKDIARLEKQIDKFELKSFLSGDYDKKNAIVSIHAGQGGIEAMDWTNMLFRMYKRYCERKELNIQVIDLSSGEEAGIKSVTFKAEGPYAYGYLKGEAGTHRLVRQSPFNADNLRQTSFSLVEAIPEFEAVDLPDIEIKDEDCQWQFFRSSTQGGQNVQKVSTAVRLKHKPTGITVTSQVERYQEQNRKIALDLLRSKLWLREQAMEQEREKEIKGEYRPASWGNQIRSYVLHPYKMVKDLRTKVETGDTEAVLDGELDEFIDAQIRDF